MQDKGAQGQAIGQFLQCAEIGKTASALFGRLVVQGLAEERFAEGAFAQIAPPQALRFSAGQYGIPAMKKGRFIKTGIDAWLFAST